MSASELGAAQAADGVEFIDTDYSRRILLDLFKQIAHAAVAHAHKHLHKVRTRNREERNVCLARDGARQQSFAGSRRANQQNALGNAPAQLLEILRLAQEL